MRASHRPSPGQPGAGPGEPARPRRTAVLVATAAGLLAADVLTKVVVVAELMGREPVRLPGHFLWLTHARNPGAAFSFAEGATVLFTAVAAIVVAVIVRTATRLRSAAWAVSLGLVLGGAAGNLTDRLFRSPGPLRGHVVDWISLRTPDWRMLFPIFNLADSGIVCGGILAVLLATLGYEMDGTRAGKDTPDPHPAGPPPPGPAGGPLDPGPLRPGTADRHATPGPGWRPAPAHEAPGWRPGGVAGDGYAPSAGPLAGPGRPAPGPHHPGAGP